MVKHIIPNNLQEALNTLNAGPCHIMAGGTDLMIQKRNTAGTPPKFMKDVLYIANLEELNYVKKDGKRNCVLIGASSKLEDISHHPDVPNLLKDIIREIGSPGIRHSATLAGNIANASPAGDSLVALYLYDAEVVLSSVNGERVLPISKFITGVRRIDLRTNELIKEIIIPLLPVTKYKWVKVGGRRADSISKVSFAGLYLVNFGLVSDIRFAFGSVSAMVARSVELENSLKNRPIEQIIADLPRILDESNKLIAPIDDQRSNKVYRRKVATNIIESFINGIQ
ncbi:MAG: FAD binding domain-containing protein [Bacilli bacterium]|jgi:CO/xanthine dehydrogenase FAD-binding subunit|nr:FAD binding domain-containing protein [Bacilli bacterium]